MRIERIWSMPSRWTFDIKAIKELLDEEMGSGMMIDGHWADPFAGKRSRAQVRNDLNPKMAAEHHLDALEFLKSQDEGSFDGVLYDPPYSMRQAVECYESFGKGNYTASVSSMKYWADCKDEVARILRPGGKAICFGWNTNGLGKSRGFEMTRVLVIPHGGSKNDTLVTVETPRTKAEE